jgi:acetyltransferase-like isoleucine patch superfamily enzyme
MIRAKAVAARIERSVTWRLSQGLFGRVCRACIMHQSYIFGDPRRVRIARTAVVNDAFLSSVSGSITIGDNAFLGFGVQLLTGTHDYSKTGAERQRAVPTSGRDIVIGDGAWVASGAIVLGPCVIGKDAVVAAGAVVHGDVPEGAVVGGVPARALASTPSSGAGL